MLVAGLAFMAAHWTRWSLPVVVLALAANWFGDSLDGTLARVRNRQRPRYGYYVDHVIDIVGTLFLFGGLALSGYMNPFVAMGLLVAYLMVSAEVFLATHARGVFRMASFGIGPTELRIVLAIGALALLGDPRVSLGSFGAFRLFDVGGVIAIAGLAVSLVVSAIRNTRSLYLDETVCR
jgi:phosphatidylglycerophosphate synthase